MDFSKPVVKDRVNQSLSGGSPEAQVIIYRLVEFESHSSDTALEGFIRERKLKGSEGVMPLITSILLKFRKLLEMMATYPNRRDNVLSQMKLAEMPLTSQPIGLLVAEVQEKVEILI
jgi:hypothetical protein